MAKTCTVAVLYFSDAGLCTDWILRFADAGYAVTAGMKQAGDAVLFRVEVDLSED